MDGIANVTKQQLPTNINIQGSDQNNVSNEKSQISSNQAIENQNKKIMEDENEVKSLVNDLNSEISMLNTSLRFGVDKEDIFYVSVIDQKTDKMIRRWPAEEAKAILPKMKELTGILFDTKG